MTGSTPRFIDAIGQQHPLAGADARIVSLVPSITELLFSLGLADRLVGRTTFCVHPQAGVQRVPRVGGTKTPDMARIAALRPTHVVVNVDENRRDHVDELQALGARVVVTHPQGPYDNPPLYRLLGGMFGAAAQAADLCRRFDAGMAALRQGAASHAAEQVLYLIWRRPWMTVSADTYVARTLALIGWQVVAARSPARYPELDPEEPAWRQADRVLLSSEPYPFKQRHADEVRAHLGHDSVPVQFIDGEMTSWYGSRAIAGLDYLRGQVAAARFP